MTFALRSRRAETSSAIVAAPTVSRSGAGNQAALRRLSAPIQRACAACDEEKTVQRRSADGAEPDHVPKVVHEVLGGSGRPLDPASRAFMEPRFGQDFSAVRVHTGEQATAAARSINARAFTSGDNIVFADGAYSPQTTAGRQTLAHELTHVVQQGDGAALSAGVGPAGDVHERQADHVAATVAAGGRVHGLGGGGGGAAAGAIQRIWDRGDEMDLGPLPGDRPPLDDRPYCPTNHIMPDDIYAALATAWGKSDHGKARVQEHGGRVVTDRAGAQQIRTGGGGSGSISLPGAQAGDTTLGTFHTHPYSTSEGSHLGVGLSGQDIENFVRQSQGNFKYVGAGTCNYALVTISQTDKDRCKKTNLVKRFDKKLKATTGTLAARVEAAGKVAIEGCGMCYYKACQPDAASPIPKAMGTLWP